MQYIFVHLALVSFSCNLFGYSNPFFGIIFCLSSYFFFPDVSFLGNSSQSYINNLNTVSFVALGAQISFEQFQQAIDVASMPMRIIDESDREAVSGIEFITPGAFNSH